jgi:hypothetical protein
MIPGKENMPADLRELRLWHYRQALKRRALAEGFKALANNAGDPNDGRFRTARTYNEEADLHDSAVGVLDDVVDGPVEEDHKRTPT